MTIGMGQYQPVENVRVYPRSSFNRYSLTVILCTVSFVASQRFIFSELYAYACLVPFLMAILVFNGNVKLRNTLLLMALFMSVDNGGEVYAETASLLRYLMYFTALFALLADASFSIKRSLLYLTFLTIPIFITISNLAAVHLETLQRDLIVVLLTAIIFLRTSDSLQNFGIDDNLLSKVIMIYLCGELFNIMFYYSISTENYLNYDSTKSLIVFSTFYFLLKGRFIIAFLVGVITLIVLFGYVSRMILLTYLVTLAGFLLFHILDQKTKFKYMFYFLFGLSVLFSIVDFSSIAYENYKFSWFLFSFISNTDKLEILRFLDPVRHTEWALFFDRNILEILFGSGFGSGIYDTHGLLDFVAYESTAFSFEELSSGIFYNFHDLWTDIGLRFGLLAIILIFIPIVGNLYSVHRQRSLCAMILFVLLNCAFFSAAGLIVTAFFFLAFRGTFGRKEIQRSSACYVESEALMTGDS